jgi:hypothetical protein
VVEYSYLNKFSQGDALSPINMMSIIQKIGYSKYISAFDATKGTGRPVLGLIING